MVFGKRNTLKTQLCRLRLRTTFEQTKEVICQKDCSKYNSKYIGEIGQTLKPDIKTGKDRSVLLLHIKNNKGDEVNWENQ